MREEETGAAISDVIPLLDDKYASSIVAEASTEAMSANELADRCNELAL